MGQYIIVALAAYLLGSVPFGYILVRLFLKQDIRETGSGNIGATNVARSGKKGLAIATLLLDALKGTAAVGFAHLVFLKAPLADHLFASACAALLAVVGHMFPVWLRFRGGKGVATGVGVFVALAPKSILVALGIFLVIVAATRYVSLGSILTAAAFPALAWWLDGYRNYPNVLAIIALVSLLIIAKHYQNIGRLIRGTESKLGRRTTVNSQTAEDIR